VEVSGTSADRATVGGTATLAGTVLLSGSGQAGTYLILDATTIAGTFAGISGSVAGTGNARLEYDTVNGDVFLVLDPATLALLGLSGNQQNVGNAINNFVNAGGTLPPGFNTLFSLTGSALGNALTQLAGEGATGMQQSAGLSMGMFLNAMLDPFVAGRSGFGAGPAGYAAAEPSSRTEAVVRDAFAAAMPVKAAPPSLVEQHWAVWGSAYGGRNRTRGDIVAGSNDRAADTYGFAGGVDYRVAPRTVIGLAAAIGETHWSVSGLGTGRAELAQVGGYASTRWQNLYLSGAVAGAWYRASTDRTVTVAGVDRLQADFDATSIGGRLEGGWRFGTMQYGVTPYGAVQVVSLRTPAYTEVATFGSNQFALSYAAQTTTDTRSELGLWADLRSAWADGTQVVLRARAAWVHDFDPGSRINAVFQTLPGASFVVDGAAAPRDAALASAAAEFRFRNGVTLIGKFDGEFSERSETYAGTGTVRYTW
jgi:outer membrane autotransporter protein